MVQNKVEVGYARSDLFERRGASDGGLGCLPTGQRGLRPCPHPDWPTSCATLQFNTIRATRPDGPWPRGAATDGEYESLKRSYDLLARVAQALARLHKSNVRHQCQQNDQASEDPDRNAVGYPLLLRHRSDPPKRLPRQHPPARSSGTPCARAPATSPASAINSP